ncbi:ABC transporter ATP-binding protein [Streptococcus alactolyticus]|uniref:ABC transporter ATP-binding protein n=1 Tax=Streptococcus alactolyticus TaxID=29389 RepID=A0A6N7X396_STRAY|nr:MULTISPECIES: ABC transporter ATP-binding protein [Streptococcus]MDE2587634.1 ABC transporter ATP-binding protein [Lactobacillales bacterium]MCF2666211.1 ABC transporter ATP-binding protein [Streptococcus alactolyticus]MCF2678379.1 ABC transporter ATP-binding protein [Streptococcus alactolyticus]MCI6904465.1 ABC transporter ATP-binding protein/permease [Streptococcus alactolyticus]MDD7362400.1 ABC transporter ATP-binding protein [Streptococcus alactolyticus]
MKARYQTQTTQRLIKDLLTQRWLVLGATIGTLMQVSLTVYLPILIGDAVDVVLSPNSIQLLLPIIAKMIAVVGLNTLIQWVNPLIYNRLTFQFVYQLRQKVMEKLNQMPIAYLDRKSAGDLVSRVTTDSEQLSNGLLMVFNQFFIGILTIVITIVAMADIDLLMVGLVLILTPLSLFLARFIAQRSYQLYQNQTKSRGQQTQYIEEMIRQESLVHLLNAQNTTIEQFTGINNTYADYSQGAIFYSSTVNPATRFINSLIYALLSGVGALRIMSGGFTIGELTTFLNYVNQYTKPFNDISSVLSELQSTLACAERLYSILDEKSEPLPVKIELDAENIKGQIDFKAVSFGYTSQKTLIKHLDLSIPPASKVAIVGPTGAGKSTLINLLMRFYELNSGSIDLDGVPMSHYDAEALRHQIGMVLQETWLKVGTVHDNIAYGNPNATREEVIAAAKAAKADFFIRQLPNGYDTYLADAGASLSQGQRQLLTIARVFIKSPKILILDEATSSIDTRTELLVQEAFETLMKGRTSFIIAHRLSTIKNVDFILVMVDGDVVEYGKHHALMAKKGVYYQMQTAHDSAF